MKTIGVALLLVSLSNVSSASTIAERMWVRRVARAGHDGRQIAMHRWSVLGIPVGKLNVKTAQTRLDQGKSVWLTPTQPGRIYHGGMTAPVTVQVKARPSYKATSFEALSTYARRVGMPFLQSTPEQPMPAAAALPAIKVPPVLRSIDPAAEMNRAPKTEQRWPSIIRIQ